MTSETKPKDDSDTLLAQAQFYAEKEPSAHDVAKHVTVNDSSEIYLGIGPCRVGSKAQLFTMAASGYPAYDQPLKAIMRCLGEGIEPEPVEFSPGPTYFKETIGPYTPHESRFDPIDVLRLVRDDDWLRRHLRVVLLFRDPFAMWRSWLDLWGEMIPRETLLHNYLTAFQTVHEIGFRLRELNFETVVFDYEKNRSPEQNYTALFESIELDREPVVSGWKDEKTSRRIDRNWRPFKEPEKFLPDGIREDVKKADGIYYDPGKSADVTDTDRIEAELMDQYRFWKDQSNQGLP